uniref:Uncharacterized protein n=1 Tax=Arundo donax TaxID=35708 RepID=A0A0A8Y9D7_ARUDO
MVSNATSILKFEFAFELCIVPDISVGLMLPLSDVLKSEPSTSGNQCIQAVVPD